eukprot:4781946-Ditylum_brightwellii.AAC.1
MPTAEKAFGFMIIKSTLEAADLNGKTRLQASGDLMSTTLLITVLQEQYMQFATQYHKKPAQLSVRWYHNLAGKIVKHCYDGNDLKKTSGVPIGDMHPENIYFANIASDIKFSSLDKRNVKIYPFTVFIQLLVESKSVLDDKGNSVTRNTFYGP